jgi:hypothetical protein
MFMRETLMIIYSIGFRYEDDDDNNNKTTVSQYNWQPVLKCAAVFYPSKAGITFLIPDGGMEFLYFALSCVGGCLTVSW